MVVRFAQKGMGSEMAGIRSADSENRRERELRRDASERCQAVRASKRKAESPANANFADPQHPPHRSANFHLPGAQSSGLAWQMLGLALSRLNQYYQLPFSACSP